MVKICPAGFGTLIDIRRTTSHLRNHRQSTQKCAYCISHTHSDQVLVRIGLSSVRIRKVNCLHGQQGLKRTHEGKHDDVFHKGSGLKNSRKISVQRNTVHQISNMQQGIGRLGMRKIHGQLRRNCHQQNHQWRRNFT